MKNYFVVRIANKPNGTVAAPTYSYETEQEALKEYYRQCALAVDSGNPTEGVTLLTSQGFQLRYEHFEHEIQPQNEAEE